MFRKYFENDLSVIPLRGKIPLIPAWQRFSEMLPTSKMIDEFEEKFKHVNLGVVLGKASGICAIDIDTDDQNIMNLIPTSSIIRVGKKGQVRFYRIDENDPPESRTFSKAHVEILSNGRQAVLPPSIHPETNQPYRWITPLTLSDVGFRGYLTSLSKKSVEKLLLALERTITESPVLSFDKEGRNNKLVDIVTAMRSRGEPEEKIIKEIYEFDLEHHVPRLFTDPNEPYRATNEMDAKLAAWEFVNSVTRSLIRNKIVHLDLSDQEELFVEDEMNTVMESAMQEEMIFIEPSPGLLLEAINTIREMSPRNNHALATGGAISFFSILLSNKFTFQKVWTNTYVLNIADTGSGKNTPQEFCKNALHLLGAENLIGMGGYRSGVSFIKNLSANQNRLDIVDEATSIFETMNSRSSFLSDLSELMCAVWTCSNSILMAPEQKTEKTTASCYHPCVNLLASTTAAGLKKTLSKTFFSKGLIPRFLVFTQNEYQKYKGISPNSDILLAKFVAKIRHIYEMPYRFNPKAAKPELGRKYEPIKLGFKNAEDREWWLKQMEYMSVEIEDRTLMEVEKQMITRKVEQVIKLGIIHCVCRVAGRQLLTPPIDANDEYPIMERIDLIWGMEIFRASLWNFRNIMIQHEADTAWARDLGKIKDMVLTSNAPIPLSQIIKSFPDLEVRKTQALIDQLRQTNDIKEVKIAGKKHYVSDASNREYWESRKQVTRKYKSIYEK